MYSLLALEFRLPNKTTTQVFTIDDWDILFLSNPLYKKLNDINEDIMWAGRYKTLTKLETFQLKLYKAIYK
jgi:hypothetical protein